MQVSITEALVSRLRDRDQQPAEIWDSKVTGLLIRTYASGRATWFVRARTCSGKKTRIKLGEHPHLGIAEARRAALGQLAAVQQGGDPVAEKRATRAALQAARKVLTVGAALAEWQAARGASAGGPWSLRYERVVTSAVRVHVPAGLRSKPLRDVGREIWMAMIGKVARDKPGAGASLYTMMSSFLGYAEALGWIEHHPLPRRGRNLIAPHVPARIRVLEDWEWLAVWVAAEREVPKLRVYVRLLILTATRVSEVADIAMGEIVADGAIWVIPAARVKNRRDHLVPLEVLARHELHLVHPHDGRHAEPSRMLLGRFSHRGFTGQGKLLRRIHQASGTKEWTWHDLRRTARTTMSYLGVAEADAEAGLNHVSGRGKLVGIYDQSGPPASALTALRTWQRYVADIVEGRRPAGDAEQQYRAALPEELRYRPTPKFVPRVKAKPGRPPRQAAAPVE